MTERFLRMARACPDRASLAMQWESGNITKYVRCPMVRHGGEGDLAEIGEFGGGARVDGTMWAGERRFIGKRAR